MQLAQFIEDAYLPEIGRRLKPKTVHETGRIVNTYILPAFGEREIGHIRYKDVLDLHQRMERTPYQANRVHATLSAIYGLAVRRGDAQTNPCAGISLYRERPRERYLTPDEITRLKEAMATDRAGRFLALLLLTGARPSELKTSRWEWLRTNVLRLPDSKRGARNIFLSPDALDLLGTPKSNGLIFEKLPDLCRAWVRVTKRAGIEGARMYDLRHTFASEGLADGLSLPVIGLLLGHRQPQTTLRYAHLAPEVGLDAVARISRRMAA